MIEWEEGAVCYAKGKQWNNVLRSELIICIDDFQLNEPREGYYIPKSELDTEEKYNQAVEVFGLFGYEWLNKSYEVDFGKFVRFGNLVVMPEGSLACSSDEHYANLVKLTFDQLMAIGELKRKMNEPVFGKNEDGSMKLIEPNTSELPSSSNPKSKEAYRILESMGVEWDNAEGKWFKVSKEWL